MDGDVIGIVIDLRGTVGSVDLVAHGPRSFTLEAAAAELAAQPPRGNLAADPQLPAEEKSGTGADCFHFG